MNGTSSADIPTWAYRSITTVVIAALSWFLVDNLQQNRTSVNTISVKTDGVMREQQEQRVLIETIKGDVKVLQRSDQITTETLKDMRKENRNR